MHLPNRCSFTQTRLNKCSRQQVRVLALDGGKRVNIPKDTKKKDTLGLSVNESLKLASVTLTGNDNALLEATCKLLAERLVYFPVYCRKYIEGHRKVPSLQDAISNHGWDAIREDEDTMLRGICDQLKCVTATLANGANVNAAIYPTLLSTFIIDIEDATASAAAADVDPPVAHLVSSRAEIRIKLEPPPSKGFKPAVYLSVNDKARVCTEMALKQLQLSLKGSDIAERKVEYNQKGLKGAPPMLRQLPDDVMQHASAAEAVA